MAMFTTLYVLFIFLFKTAEFVVDNVCSLVTVVIVSIFELHRIWSH